MVQKSDNIDGESDMASTNRLLRVIIGLMLKPKDDRGWSLKQQIEVLHDFGLRPLEIATILGRTQTHVNKELSGLRRHRKQDN